MQEENQNVSEKLSSQESQNNLNFNHHGKHQTWKETSMETEHLKVSPKLT